MEVEVDEPVGVLKVQPLGKDVRGDEDVDVLVGRRGTVVERGEPADDRAALVRRTAAVDAFEAAQPFGAQVRFQVGRGVRKLGEDDDFPAGHVLVVLQQLGERGEFGIAFGPDVVDEGEEVGNLL